MAEGVVLVGADEGEGGFAVGLVGPWAGAF